MCMLILVAALPFVRPDIPIDAARENVNLFSSLDEAVAEEGVPVLLVFFAIDCSVCWEDLFEMKYFIQTHDLKVRIAGVSTDPVRELRMFLEKYAFFEPVVSDRGGKLRREFGVDLEPFKIILKDRRIIYRDDAYEDFETRRKKAKECLFEIGRK